MDDNKKSKEQIVRELIELRLENDLLKQQVADSERISAGISERTESDVLLRESEEKYRLISSLTTDYIFRLKIEESGKVRMDIISDNFTSLTDRKQEEVNTPEKWAKIIHPEDIGKLMDTLKSIISEGGGCDIECRSFLPDGNLRWVKVIAHSVTEGDKGTAKAIVGAVKDITGRKLAEEALASERTMLRNLVDLLPAFVYIKDLESRFLLANVACARYMGVSSPQDLIGKTDADFYPPGDAAIFRSDELGVLEGVPLINKEEGGFSSDGVRHILLTTKIPFKDVNDNIIGLVGVSIDFSERKEAEEAIIRAKEKAEESDRLKSAFLANMGHEIRTPMNGILGFSELLKNPMLTGAEQQEYIGIIEKSGARMLNIINDLIDISKIESGSVKVCISECNLNEQLEYINSFFRPEAEAKGLKLSCRNGLPADASVINTDREKLNAVLMNLIKNALKFTDKGSIEYGYILKPLEKKSEHPELEFFVKDTGTGISHDQQEIIFERFRQGNDSFNRNYEGAGLGLSISKSYITMLGGRMWVHSDQGLKDEMNGSIFYFTIPYSPKYLIKTPLHGYGAADNKSGAKKLSVLIAEDDPASEMLITFVIKTISEDIQIVRTGKEAVEACRNNSDIDLVLMDIKMPEMDGYEATRQIRKFNKNVVIIAQTAYAQPSEKDNAIEAGCNEYISKPIMKNELLMLIKKHFKKIENIC